MRKSILLLLLFPLMSFAQIVDDFSDGDFTNNPLWIGMANDYIVNNSQQLQLNAEQAGASYLAFPFEESQEMEWRFWIRENFSPSGNNYSDVFLKSDNADLSQSTQAYFLRFGEGGSNDAIELFRKDSEGIHSICRGSEGAIATSFAVSVKVNCGPQGEWVIQTCYDASGNYSTEAVGTDNAFPRGGYFGLLNVYTASNAKKVFFDDVYVGAKEMDVEAPVLLSHEVMESGLVRLSFNELLDEESAMKVENYNLDLGKSSPVSVSWGESHSMVVLHFAGSFESEVVYILTIRNLSDLSGNVMETVQVPFSLYNPTEADIVINEIMADPTPVVGLPEREYIELYNTTAMPVNLKGWTLSVGSTTKVFDDCTIGAYGYLIVCHSNAVEELSVYGPACGLFTSSTTIPNSGAVIRLNAADGMLVSEVAFDLSWYHDTSKDDGGWSIEQISPNNPCAGASNWTASEHELGGTPGAQNSVFDPTSIMPKIAHIDVFSADFLCVGFSQEMKRSSVENAAAYHIVELNQYAERAVFIDSLDVVSLRFNPALPEGVTLTLKVSPLVVNCVGVPVGDDESMTFVVSMQASEYDVVINEIMADPTPVVGLPEYEYVELYNTTDYVLNLEGWELQVGSNENVFGNVVLSPRAYLIVCQNTAVEAMKEFGDCVGFSSFSIANTACSMVLMNKSGHVVSRVEFSNSWYHDSEKAKGGWSVEQIDSQNPCAGASNWTASQHPSGGTPGALNSVDAINESQPRIARVSMFSNDIVQLWFDQQMDAASLEDNNHYYVKETSSYPAQANSNPLDPTFVELVFENGFEEGEVYTLRIDGVENCIGNAIEPNTEIQFGIPNEMEPGDVLISEILFDPISPCVDYVELYNHSDKTFDLSAMLLGVIKESFPNPADTTLKQIVSESRLFLPSTYVLLSTNGMAVGEHYDCSTDNFVDMASFPNYTNSGGTAVLMSKSGVVVDQMYFSEKMHYPLIKVTKGVSLERVSFEVSAADIDNWHSAAESVHFGTPGYANSMSLDVASASDVISVDPDLFSPDGDGFDDNCMVSYRFDEAGYTMNVYVFAASGQLVRHLVKGELVGSEGNFVWNGTDDHGNRVPLGIYVVVTEVFNLNGVVKTYKKGVAVATR